MLASASCALLGSHADVLAEDDWQLDTAIMHYSEADRVTATELIVAGTKVFDDDETLNLKITLDSLTGASANGAVPQQTPQTFTRPSGEGQYTVPANETPLDDTFKDTRLQLTGMWSQFVKDDYLVSLGGNFSREYDYMSTTVNGNVAKDFNKKNTTLSAGMAIAYDEISPEGEVPKPLSTMVIEGITEGVDEDNFDEEFKKTRLSRREVKSTVDLLFGLAQVINRQMIVQFNYSYSQANGYLTDPFKVVTSVNTNGEAQEYLYEHRPEKRSKHAFFSQSKYHFDSGILDASYRFMTDDWRIKSHTVDLKYFIPFEKSHSIEPHIRLYTQSAASFYQPYLVEDNTLPGFVSSDYRIGELDTFTLGIKYGMALTDGEHIYLRLEYYHQTPKSDGTDAIGILNTVDLYEEVHAVIAQVSYSF